MHAIIAGSKREAAAMAVSIVISSDSLTALTNVMQSQGQRRPREPTVKEEPKSPARPLGRKRKACSTTDSNAIEFIEPDDNAVVEITQPSGKRVKTASGSSSQVRFEGITIPKGTRKSARTTKANSKKDASELLARLGREFGAIAKTCEELSESMD